MLQKIRKMMRQENGSALVLVAGAMIVMCGFTALAVDTGSLYVREAILSQAVDAAVLAGVKELPGNPERALEIAEDYAELNGVDAEEADFVVAPDGKSLRGQASSRVTMNFAKILGISEGRVNAAAGARVGTVGAASGIIPFGVLEDDFEFGTEYTLKEGAGGSSHGWFGALRLGGNGANVYRSNIKYGYDSTIKIGDTLEAEPGNMSGPTRDGIEHRLDGCNHSPICGPEQFDMSCSRILTVPIVESAGKKSVRVLAFAAFLVDEYIGCGNKNEVRGHFVQMVVDGAIDVTAPDYGLYAAELHE